MLSFWAKIDETDIEAFAGTLVLPAYMSHLSLAPFSFSNQAANADGLQALCITYIGQGRVEELALKPKKYALDLLRFVFPTISSDSVRLPKNDAIWFWKNVLQIYFESTSRTLNLTDSALSEAANFSPFQTYVSVSRKELFIGIQVLTAFLGQWIQKLTGVCQTGDKDIAVSATANGFEFSMSKLGGELIIENDEVFADLLEFAKLKPLLTEIADLAVPNFDSDKTEVGEAGVLLPLVSARKNTKC